jgi:hypothetical protein
MPAAVHRINTLHPRACLHCYFRVKTSDASIGSELCNPAAASAVAADLFDSFNHGSLASIPRERPEAVRYPLDKDAMQTKSLAQHGFQVIR